MRAEVSEQARQAALEALIEEDRQLLAQLEAEIGPVPHNTRQVHKIERDQIVSIVGTPIDPRRLRWPGDNY